MWGSWHGLDYVLKPIITLQRHNVAYEIAYAFDRHAPAYTANEAAPGSLSNRNDFITDYLYKKYGPIIRFEGYFGSSPIILLYDAEAASQILRGENWLPVRNGFYALEYHRNNIYKKESDPPDAPTSLITDNGDVWKKFRSMVNPILLQPKTFKLYSESLKGVAEDMIKRISKFFVAKAIEEFKTNKKSFNQEKGVLEKLLEIDERIAVIMASDMLLAGVDTTANTVIAILYCLAKNPDKQTKLREEIASKEEKRSYLKAGIKESIRLIPVVSGNMRQTSKEYNILGYKIPEQMYVTFGHQVLSVMEQHYPRPKEFLPERWIVEKSHPLYYGNAHPFASSAFGFGARSCIGRRIAELEIEIFITTFIKNFEVEWFGPRPEIHVSAINYIKGPFNFVFKDV